MKVSDIIMYIMKIMWWGLKRILSSRFRDIYFIWIQTYRIFYFSRRVLAKHHKVSSSSRIFSSRSRSRKILILSISKFLFFVLIVIPKLLKTAFWQTSNHSQSPVKVCSDRTSTKSLSRRLKNIGMVSEKLYPFETP